MSDATQKGSSGASKRKVKGEKEPKPAESKDEKKEEKKVAAKKPDAKEAKKQDDSKDEKKKEKKKGRDKFAADEQLARKDLAQVPKGQRKDFSQPMEEKYVPRNVEPTWDAWWEARGLYKPDEELEKKGAEKFVMVIPPPNVTGTLHLGHALTCSIEDAITRWHRMNGKVVLWVPGTDHAGIATQAVVEKKLMREQKITRHDLGREKFIAEVWKWKQSHGSRICEQIRRLGASVDWSREAFTMNEMLGAAVQEAFIRMHKDGLIYRANRLVAWSCTLRTAISNIEVKYVDIDEPTMRKVPGYTKQVEFGVMHSFAYKFADEELKNEEIVVATTRLETMLGDVAVAVHPDDPRYQKFIGKALKHPFIPERKMKVVADGRLVDMKLGTGAVKITPAHDPNDFECGRRHNLEFINILADDGTINANGGRFAGMKRFDVRELLVEELKKMGMYRGKTANKMALALCSRSNDVIEPVMRPQWWVDCKKMAALGLKKAEDGELKILPEFHQRTWHNWLSEIQDWCISRQLWWGHRIPAYFVSIDNHKMPEAEESKYWVVAPSKEEAMKMAASRFSQYDAKTIHIQQDEDVLDTWFSSGLFPFSVLGWPKDTPDLKAYYPGSLLETGHDILFFWVARMVMMGLQLTGKLPFTTVYLHAMVRDKYGRKMSKSLGNVIDPIDVIEGITLEELSQKLRTGNLDPNEVKKAEAGQKQEFPDGISECGADALRFGLLSYTCQGRDINLDINRIVAHRQFGNKLWNATRFALRNFPQGYQPTTSLDEVSSLLSQAQNPLADRWILSKLHNCVSECARAFKDYDFAAGTTALFNFWQYQFCDIYLEVIKPVMNSDQKEALNVAKKNCSLAVLYTCLDHGLRLLHPFMPFITEELWHRLPGRVILPNPRTRAETQSIMIQPYPLPASTVRFSDANVEAALTLLDTIAHAVRSTRASLGLLAKQKIELYVVCTEQKDYQIVSSWPNDLGTMSIASAVHAINGKAGMSAVPEGCVNTVVSPTINAYVPLKGLVDIGLELIKTEKKADKLKQTIDGLTKTLTSPALKPAIREKMQGELKTGEEEYANTCASMRELNSFLTPDLMQKYLQAKIADRKVELEKEQKVLEKYKAELPKPESKKEPPKKTLAKIADQEVCLKQIQAQIDQLQAAFEAKTACPSIHLSYRPAAAAASATVSSSSSSSSSSATSSASASASPSPSPVSPSPSPASPSS